MKNKKILIVVLVILSISVIALISAFFAIHYIKNKQESNIQNQSNNVTETEPVTVVVNQQPENKVDIININSKTRPYAVVVNNTPVAVKVQTGLNKAYLVYEIPTEGNTSRLMALYKDVNDDLTIGTIRSSRHNFVDYALESDAIFVHYGWSHYAEDDQNAGSINFINGLFEKPFWRNNPENLASEHTAYTSLDKIKQTSNEKGFKSESDKTILLNYNAEDVDLSANKEAKAANKIVIPYGAKPNVTTFVYDSNTKMYNRMENDKNCIDYNTKEQVNTKNIIVQKINYSVCSDNYYWDLKTIGSGKGYFITNGYAVPITWKKDSRAGKTRYYYSDGSEIEVSDGRTYIELQVNSQNLTIE
ncbi:MAG: DUF3048 domain-containing protein [Clostridia bacterium]|nr:DUF3048 domain-containing protein [Clostridia bacterium]